MIDVKIRLKEAGKYRMGFRDLVLVCMYICMCGAGYFQGSED